MSQRNPQSEASPGADAQPTTSHRRFAVMIAFVLLAMAATGYIIGITEHAEPRWDDEHERDVAAREQSSGRDAAPQAPRYAQIDRRAIGPNAEWENHLSKLRAPVMTYVVDQSEAAREAAIEARHQRRAYDGAPPVVPHPIVQDSSASCLVCHENGLQIGNAYAKKMSHAKYASCTQCHVAGEADFAAVSAQMQQAFPEAEWDGMQSPSKGSRAYVGAPPTVPHSTWMRENCMSCHGPSGHAALRTTHPERQSCTQCHVPEADLHQRPAAKPPALVGGGKPPFELE